MSPRTLLSAGCLCAAALLSGCAGKDATTPGVPGASALNAPAAADAVGPSVDAAQLPWHIDATVATTPAEPPDGCLVYYTSVIEGTATHLGTFTGVGSTCITHAIQGDPNPPFLPAGPGPYLTADFNNPRWTLTAADGDELWITNTDAVAVISLTDGSLRGVGTERIIGGTGRFAGATGEAEVSALNVDGIGPDDFQGDGWIRFRAADSAGR